MLQLLFCGESLQPETALSRASVKYFYREIVISGDGCITARQAEAFMAVCGVSYTSTAAVYTQIAYIVLELLEENYAIGVM